MITLPFKQLLTEVHKYNHIETSQTAFLSNNELQYDFILHDQYTIEGNVVKIHGPLPFGIYYFDGRVFILDIDMAGNEYIEWIRHTKFVHVIRANGKRHCLYLFNIYNLPYQRATRNGEVINTGLLEHTINTNIDKIIVTGHTQINMNGSRYSPDSPASLISTTKVHLHSENMDNTESDDIEIKLKSGLKCLPSGVGDILIIDNIGNTSYRINKVGRMIITGIETGWVEIESAHTSGANGHSVYFYPTDYPQIGDNTGDVLSNCFNTVSYTEMFSNDNVDYAICNSNDINNNGFFIKVPNRIADNLDKFKEWLRDSSKRGSSEPVIIEYHLKQYRWSTIALERYNFKTYYGGTVIVASDNVNRVSFFCRTFGINYDNFIPTGAALDAVDGVIDPIDSTYYYPSGQNIYKYDPTVARLYGSIDKFYGYDDGINIIKMPNQDRIGNKTVDLSLIDYRYFVSNQNPMTNSLGYVPVGCIIQWYIKGVAPEGFIEYHGQELSRSEYPELFEVLGTTWGDGDGSTTFGLPDQDHNDEDISQEDIDSMGFWYLICAKPNTVLPVGACILWYGNYDLPPAGYVQADGIMLNKLDYYKLYEVFGNKYGETANQFKLPNQNAYDYADGVIEYDKLENFSYIIKAL